MKKDQSFVHHVEELLAPLGQVTSRAMFGGWAIYVDGLTIGIVVDGTLFLKADAGNIPDFEALQLGPFTYETERGTMKMSYYKAPDAALEQPGALIPWARGALAAAHTAAAKKKKTTTRKGRT